jgi:hypothetical protein
MGIGDCRRGWHRGLYLLPAADFADEPAMEDEDPSAAERPKTALWAVVGLSVVVIGLGLVPLVAGITPLLSGY